jgi:hypothetical protein
VPTRLKLLLVTAPLFGLLTYDAYAAETATLSGIVRDPTDAAIVNAAVTIHDESTAAERRTFTNNAGLFTVPSLTPGQYSVKISAAGFKELESTHLLLGVAETKQIDFTLEVGQVSQAISVEDTTSLINTSDASVGMTIDSQFVSNLPLNGRSFQQLITLAPGVNLVGLQGSAGGRAIGEFSVDGQRPTSNYFTVDGVSANLGYGVSGYPPAGETLNAAGTTTSLVSVDALQEFKILTSSFAPEFGRTPGGQVILLTRSGTNSFHGTLFEYFRNDALNANDWFANSQGQGKAPLRFNDFGGTLGGPILRNKTFFFFSYECQLLRQPQFAIVPVPDLPSRQASPAATQPILSAFPVPNGPELGDGQAQFAGGYSNPISTNSLSLRLDHDFSASLTSFFRISHAPSSSTTRQSDPANLARLSYRAETYTAGLTQTITPVLVNELRLNFSRNSVPETYTIDGFGGAISPATSAVFVAPFTGQNASALVYAGSLGFELGLDHTSTQRQVNLIDSVSYTVGSHQLKFGIDYLRSLPIVSQNAYDYYAFNGVSDLTNNAAPFFLADYTGPVRSDALNFSLYVQDTWRPFARLTVTYGLHWDVNPPPHDRFSNNGNYVPLLGNYATGNVSVGIPGSSLWATKYANVAPRIGVAYQIRQIHGYETVIRAGAGLFYDVAEELALNGPFSNFPDSLTSDILTMAPLPISPQEAAIAVPSLTNPKPGSYFAMYPRDLAAPRSWQWNLSTQQGLGEAQTITVSYVGNIGTKLLYNQEYPNVGPSDYTVVYTDNSGRSNYQALQVQFRRRLSRGLAAALNYTWAHSLDDSSEDGGSVIQPPNTFLAPLGNWGSSDFDIRHNFSGALTWDVPNASGTWLHSFIRGWGLDAITTARTALPIDVVQYTSTVFGGYDLRPDVVPGEPLYLSDSNVGGGRRINPAAFVVIPGAQGNLGRNALRGFDLVNTDLSARRTFHLTERLSLLLRGDLFNIFNHPNFANPVSTLNSGTFGFATSMANSFLAGSGSYPFAQNSVFQTGGPRSVQLSLKLVF